MTDIDVERASRAELIAHIDALEFRLTGLTAGRDEILRLRGHFGLTQQDSYLLAALARGGVVPSERLLAAISNWKEELTPASVNVIVHRVRAKLRHFNISIRNVFAEGYQLDAQDLAVVRAVMKGEAQ